MPALPMPLASADAMKPGLVIEARPASAPWVAAEGDAESTKGPVHRTGPFDKSGSGGI